MLKKFLFFYLTLLSLVLTPHYAIGMELNDEGDPRRLFVYIPPKEKTAKEILEENKDKPEFMGCAEWLKKEHPDFSEEKFSFHPLFRILQEAMQLADFEVDALENFTHKYMETDMPKEQAESMIGLRGTSCFSKQYPSRKDGRCGRHTPALFNQFHGGSCRYFRCFYRFRNSL